MSIELQKISDTIIDEVKFTVYSSLIAEKLNELGIYDMRFWHRETFEKSIKNYPNLLTIDANFLVGKFEGFHDSGIASLYQEILTANELEDSESLRRDFGFLLARRFQKVQLMEDPDVYPILGYTLEQRKTVLNEDSVGGFVFFGGLRHEPTYSVCQKDLMKLEGFNADTLTQEQKSVFFSMPLHPVEIQSLDNIDKLSTDSLPSPDILAGAASKVIGFVNADFVQDKAVQISLLPKNVLSNVEALSAAARICGGYSVQKSALTLSEEHTERLEEKYNLGATELRKAGLGVLGVAQGIAIFDAATGNDEFKLIKNTSEQWYDLKFDDPLDRPEDLGEYWSVSQEVFSPKIVITRDNSMKIGFGGMSI